MSDQQFRLAVVSGGTSDPSSTRMLADRIADRVGSLARDRDEKVTVDANHPLAGQDLVFDVELVEVVKAA